MQIKAEAINNLLPWIDGFTLVGVVGGTAKIFEWFDGLLNDTGREALSRWLRNARAEPHIESWATVFPRLIDIVFGARPLSVKFILRSCIASMVAVTLVTCVYARLVPTPTDLEGWDIGTYGALLAMAVVANFIPDYLSLLASRYIVARMAQHPSMKRIGALLLADTAITAVIALFGLTAVFFCEGMFMSFAYGLPVIQGGFESINDPTFYHFRWLLPYSHVDGFMNIFFYSAFFTSVWVWLYVVAGVTIKLLHKASFVWKRILPYLDVEKRPLVAVGRIAGLLAGATYVFAIGALWSYRFLHR